MKKIDALGKPCPIPVIETKKVIRELGDAGGQIEVLVDNEVAIQNIEKMALGLGLQTTAAALGEDRFTITLTVPAKSENDDKHQDKGAVIAIGKKTMGEGSSELGELLMKSYLYSLTELDQAPSHLIFFNEGAFLTNEGANVLNDLRTLQDKGTQISTCGTCLDYYEIKETLAIGDITNMYTISEIFAAAEKVISL